ncbi:hypothetical protein GY45DRAFT_1436969 [Cubamyces sp. BRFM 1775]|nr:hypothetical protein GY45DRAFT_1436969 [Cubamyces sp. BRFM 1775]
MKLRAAVHLLLAFAALSRAYVPAHATDSEYEAEAAGQNFTDPSRLVLSWWPDEPGTPEQVSHQISGQNSTGISRGAFVHFSEDNLLNGTTPWVAWISCDESNTTSPYPDTDIFTLAYERGAKAAILYSVESLTCYLTSDYSKKAKANPTLDIYMTQSLGVSRWVEDQFKQRIPADLLSNHSSFDPVVLNSSMHTIEEAFPDNAIPKRGYIIASLYASVNGTLANPGSSSSTSTSAPAGTPTSAATSVTSHVELYSKGLGWLITFLIGAYIL